MGYTLTVTFCKDEVKEKFLLDTDSCIYVLKHNPAVLKNLLAHIPEDIAVSVITEAELRAGAARSASPGKTLRRLENFLRPGGPHLRQ